MTIDYTTKLIKLKEYLKAGQLPDGRPFTYKDYWRVKGQLMKSEEITREDIIKVFGGRDEK